MATARHVAPAGRCATYIQEQQTAEEIMVRTANKRAMVRLPVVRRWIDTNVPLDTNESDPGIDRVDWLRASPFLAMHVACLAVFWVGASAVAMSLPHSRR